MDNREYEGSELELFQYATRWKSYLKDKLSPYIHGKVLEVGAGIGANTILLKNPKCHSWTSLEPDSSFSVLMKSKFKSTHGFEDVQVVNGFVNQLDTNLGFQSILYIDVLEHIPNDIEEFKSAYELLAPGGYMVTLSPAFQYLFSEFDTAIGHHRRYSKKQKLSLAHELDLNLVDCFFLDSMGVFASLANKWFLKKPAPSIEDIELWDKKIVPVSIWTDKIFGKLFGKSIVAIWQKPDSKEESPTIPSELARDL